MSHCFVELSTETENVVVLSTEPVGRGWIKQLTSRLRWVIQQSNKAEFVYAKKAYDNCFIFFPHVHHKFYKKIQ